jgi:signal transduction histidine kinase
MISSLQTRLLLAVGVLAVAAVAAVAFSARESTRVEFQRFQDVQKIRASGAVEAALERAAARLDGACCDTLASSRVNEALDEDQAVFVFNTAGLLLLSAGSGVDPTGLTATFKNGVLDINSLETSAGALAGMKVTLRGGPMKTIRLADGAAATVHVLPLVPPEANLPAEQFLGSVDRRLLIVTAAVAAFALLLTWAITRRIVGPIADLRNATRDLAAGQLSRRVSATGTDEVAELARGFNQMASALERQEELRRNLVHDVAHELRTPLTALRCRVESVLDGLVTDPTTALRQVNEEVAHLSQLVSDLEELARAEARELTFVIADTAVADVCRSAVRVAGLDGDSRLRLELDEAVRAQADATRLRQIVLNLLTNADRHTPPDGVISVRASADGDATTIDVHNTGSALTADEQRRVFDRFYRADLSRQRATGGTGLGLAIVKQLTEAQGGRVSASSDAAGVTFSVSLPSNP